MFFVGRLILRELHFIYKNKLYMFLIVKAFPVLVEESSQRRFARYVHVKNWNFLFYCSNIAKSENAMLWRMLSRLETCIVYCCIWTVTLSKSIVPRKTWQKLWHSYISKLFPTFMYFGWSASIFEWWIIYSRRRWKYISGWISGSSQT
jgi:hypothetical protein